jgi:hypothetical protein
MTSIWKDNLANLYASDIAVDATLTAGSGDPLAIRAMDKTTGVAIGSENEPEIQTIYPVAVIAMSTLTDNGLTADDVDGGSITIDGKAWTVTSHRYKPSPEGETRGELILLLKDGEI